MIANYNPDALFYHISNRNEKEKEVKPDGYERKETSAHSAEGAGG
jgi:hypothetical protein